MSDRPEVGRLKQERDPDALLRGYAHMVTTDRLTGCWPVQGAGRCGWHRPGGQEAVGDMAIPAALRRAISRRSAGRSGRTARRFGAGRSRRIIVWVHNDPALYQRLVIERRWAKKRFEEWLYQTPQATASPVRNCLGGGLISSTALQINARDADHLDRLRKLGAIEAAAYGGDALRVEAEPVHPARRSARARP